MKRTSAILLTAVCVFLSFNSFGKEKKEQTDRNFEISKNLDIYNSLFRELDIFYVDTIQPEKLIIGSIEKMLTEVDPYTNYIPEEEIEDFKFMTTGEYGGIGSIISQKKNKDIIISEPYEGMPAQKAGLRAGDIIREVDGVKIKDKTVSEVSELLKGQQGTEVKVIIERPNENKTIEKTITREKIQINPVSYYGIVGEKTGYILLNQFTDKAADEVKAALFDLKKNNQIESIILDLRNNPGGLLDQAVKISNFFIPYGEEVLATRGKIKQWDNIYKTTQEPIYPDIPLAVLVNGSSASAAEIVAGAMQDLDRGVIVGTRTFGKGLVQATREISYSGHLKVTTAKYYTPSGRCIQAIDYAQRKEDGSIAKIPDSLMTEFKTKAGRIVKDGGGIMPDVEVKDDKKMNIAYYLYMQNMIFDFATEYSSKHKKIAPAQEFEITENDYNDFKEFLKKKEFTYTTKSSEYLTKLKEVIDYEGYAEISKVEFDTLKEKLSANIERDLDLFRTDIEKLLIDEIIKRYYFQKGSILYRLKNDPELEKALEILTNKEEYTSILSPKKED